MRNPLLCRKVSAPLGEGRLDALSALAVEALEWDNRTSDPETAYTQARYKLRELAKSLDNLLPVHARKLRREVTMAKYNLDSADRAAEQGDYPLATQWQHGAALALRLVVQDFKANKVAYGYDVSGDMGEIFTGSEPIANRENQKNLRDENEMDKQDETDHNPANLTRDYEAEKDYSFLRTKKNQKLNWPIRDGKPHHHRLTRPYPAPR